MYYDHSFSNALPQEEIVSSNKMQYNSPKQYGNHLNATATELCCWPLAFLYGQDFLTYNRYIQNDTVPCHVISDWFHEHVNEFSGLPWHILSPDRNPTFGMWWFGWWVTAIISTWIRISKNVSNAFSMKCLPEILILGVLQDRTNRSSVCEVFNFNVELRKQPA